MPKLSNLITKYRLSYRQAKPDSPPAIINWEVMLMSSNFSLLSPSY